MSIFMDDIENFLQNPGAHKSHSRFEEMKETLEFMKNNAKGINNLIATDRVIEHLNSKGYDINKEDWQISVKGYLWDNGIFIGSKTMRGLKIEDTPVVEGHRLYYNFIKPHESLDGKTPSEEAGITIEGNNKWLILMRNAMQYKKANKEKFVNL